MFLTVHNCDNFDSWYKSAKKDGAIALIDKAKNWTSFDVVAKLRKLTKIKKVGHSGTLDPLATGLLLVLFGKFTKKALDYQNLNKAYSGIIKIGARTETDDSEAEEFDVKDISHIMNEDIFAICHHFLGTITQIPPKFSAKKISGKPQYKLARNGQIIKSEPIKVEIFEFNIQKINLPYIEFNIVCSKGTYIRALARDLGEKLGVGGYLYSLRRNKIGEFNVEDALTVEMFSELINKYGITNESI